MFFRQQVGAEVGHDSNGQTTDNNTLLFRCWGQIFFVDSFTNATQAHPGSGGKQVEKEDLGKLRRVTIKI